MASCIFSFITIVISTLPMHATSLKPKTCIFCKERHTGVTFKPLVSIEDTPFQNRYDLNDIMIFVSQISTEFTIIGIELATREFGHEITNLLLTVVATWNSNNLKSQHAKTLEAWVLYDSEKSSNVSEETFHIFQQIVERANSIHNQTITSIILSSDSTKLKSESSQRVFSYARKFFLKPLYKVGLLIDARNFERFLLDEKHNVAQELNLTLVHFDSIHFITRYDDFGTFSSGSSILQREVKIIKYCTEFLQKSYNRSLEFGVFSTWPDTTNQGLTSYSRMVEFWKGLVMFGKSENFTVVFSTAFDNPYGESPKAATRGWWRLQENSSYTSSSQFVFLDKNSLAKDEKQQSTTNPISRIKNDIALNNSSIIAKFTPLTSIFDAGISKGSNASFLSILVNKLASRFDSLYIFEEDVSRWDWKENGTCILFDIISKHCSNSGKNVTITVYTESSDYSEIVLFVNKIANANKLYPNLINQIILPPIKNDSEVILKIRNMLNQPTSKVQVLVGYMLAIEACSGLQHEFHEPEIMETILQNVDVIYFSYFPGTISKRGYRFGVDRVLSQVTTRFENCKRRVLSSTSSRVSVGFQTGYPDSLASRKDDYVSLAIFWKEMTLWAERADTTVVLFEAFEPLQKDNAEAFFGHSMGWWRFQTNLGLSNDFVIEEKRVVALERFRKSNEKQYEERQEYWLTALISTIASLSVVISIFFIIKQYRRKMHKGDLSHLPKIEASNSDIIVLKASAFAKETSTLIGVGNFGTVYKCFMPRFQADVAIKTVSPDEYSDSYMGNSVKSLLSEIKVMSSIGDHENILRLLGVCQENGLFIVTEYCENGSLLTYLRYLSAKKHVLPAYELLQYCAEIANGMQFLEENSVIHGDLSARNVLLDGHKTCKISDFGLSRQMEAYEKYVKKGEEPLPWRWMAIESLTRLEFSAKSDVWSMGVTFWEVFTMGKLPFPEMAWDGAFCDRVLEGLRLGRPEFATEKMYNMMLSCWEPNSKLRPSSKEVASVLNELKSIEYINV